MKATEKNERNPVVMLLAVVMLLIGMGLMFIGVTNFASLGWLYAMLIIASGFGTTSLAAAALVTGKGEWLLIDLILPG